MKLKNIFKNSLFLDSFKLAKSNPSKLGMMILFDGLFLISFFILLKFFKYVAGILTFPTMPNSLSSAIVLVTFGLIYYLIALFVYSFFKYCLLDFIKSLFGPGKFSFRRLGQFYLLNIIIAAIFFGISIIAGAVLINLKESYQPYVFIILASPFWVIYNKYAVISLHSLIFYIVVNLSTRYFMKALH